jgi:hypothetical protein
VEFLCIPWHLTEICSQGHIAISLGGGFNELNDCILIFVLG